MEKNFIKINNIISISIGVILGIISHYFVDLKYQIEFREQAHLVINELNSNINLYKNSLVALRSMYEIDEAPLNFYQFESYNQKTLSHFNFQVRTIFYRYISQNQVKNFEKFMQNHSESNHLLYENYKQDLSQIQKHNLLVQYAYPFDHFKNSIGKNILMMRERSESVKYAIQHDIGLSSTNVERLVKRKQPVVILFMPIFNKSAKNRNIENLYGLVSMGVEIDQLFKSILEQKRLSNMLFYVIDITNNASNSVPIFKYEPAKYELERGIQYHSEMKIGGRIWAIQFQATTDFLPPIWRYFPFGIALLGFFVSLSICRQFHMKSLLEHKTSLLEKSEILLQSHKEELKNVIDMIPLVFVITNAKDGNILLYNKRLIEVFELTVEPKNAHQFYANLEQREIFKQHIKMQGGSVHDFEMLFRKENNEIFCGLVSVKTTNYQMNAVFLVTINDITHRKKNEDILRLLATTDGLTGLYNRRHFLELAHQEILQSIDQKKSLAVLMLDIDFFKKINDTYGHDIGDKVIQHLTTYCTTFLMPEAIIGRLGGEEFAIVLPDTDLEVAWRIANSLRENIYYSKVIFNLNNESLSYTISIGISILNDNYGIYQNIPHQDIEDLLKLADKALYQAKNTGRNKVCS